MKSNNIKDIQSRMIIDSRGNPTIEADVHLENGEFGRASIPSGASTGDKEALELRDNQDAYHGKSVQKAIKNIQEIEKECLNIGVENQEKIDLYLFVILRVQTNGL